jgi:hypothetical protein
MNLKSKKMVIAAAIVVPMVCFAGFMATRGGEPAAIKGKTPEEIREFVRSDEFREMDQDKRREIGRAAFGQMREVREKQMIAAAEEYCRLETKAERVAYLDEKIDEISERMEKWQAARAARGEAGRGGFGGMRRPGGEGGRQRDGERGGEAGQNQQHRPGGEGRMHGGRGRRGPISDRIRARSERMSPEKRAIMGEVREAMFKRMEERGIEMPFGRHGGR